MHAYTLALILEAKNFYGRPYPKTDKPYTPRH